MTKALFERSKKIVPGGVHSPVRSFAAMECEPVFFRSARGAEIQDTEGKTYIDFCQSFGPMILGHRDRDVEQAISEAGDIPWSLGACEPYSLELAEWISAKIPWVEKLRFVNSGTEAVMTALRVARAATGRNKIVKFEGCYHGHVDSMLVKAGSGLAGESASSSAGVSEMQASETLLSALDDEAALEQVFQTYAKEIAAVIVEPLPANYGLLEQRKEFLQKIFQLAYANNSLVIFDEVISGFRMATGGMAELYGFEPDLVTYGKVMGGGFPVGCYGGKNKYLSLVAPEGSVYQAGTLSANPIGMLAGLTTLKKVESENIREVLAERTEKFCQELESDFHADDIPLRVSRMGSLFWIHRYTENKIRRITQIPSEQSADFKKFYRELIQAGIYFAPNAFEVNFMSYAHSPEVLGRAREAIRKAAKKAYA